MTETFLVQWKLHDIAILKYPLPHASGTLWPGTRVSIEEFSPSGNDRARVRTITNPVDAWIDVENLELPLLWQGETR